MTRHYTPKMCIFCEQEFTRGVRKAPRRFLNGPLPQWGSHSRVTFTWPAQAMGSCVHWLPVVERVSQVKLF
jgi:hypothetical protein